MTWVRPARTIISFTPECLNPQQRTDNPWLAGIIYANTSFGSSPQQDSDGWGLGAGKDLGLMEDRSFKVEHQIITHCFCMNHLKPPAPF